MGAGPVDLVAAHRVGSGMRRCWPTEYVPLVVARSFSERKCALPAGEITRSILRRYLAIWPLAARAQQSAMPVIGFLNGGSPDGYETEVNAFQQGLKEVGYIDGQNMRIEFRWANDQYSRLTALADNLVGQRVSVIVANTPANIVAKATTSTISIVFTTGGDPVKLGLIASLDRPGGNVTGVTQLTGEVAPKRLEFYTS